MRFVIPHARRFAALVGIRHPAQRAILIIVGVVILVFAATAAAVFNVPASPPAGASPTGSPTSCERKIGGVLWTLDPCIAAGEPVPPDFAYTIASFATCPTASSSPTSSSPTGSPPIGSPTSVSAGPTAAAGGPAQARRAPGPIGPSAVVTPTSTVTGPPPAPSATFSPSATSSSAPGPSPTGFPSPSATARPPQCPDLGDPVPWPGYPPIGSPSPTPSDSPSPSPSESAGSCQASPGPALAAEPKDESADLIKCRKPADLPDPNKPITLIAAGNSLVSAHHQTGFGLEKCVHTAADNRGLIGNDANFSFVGRYYDANKQIAAYYNFARTGYGTDTIRTAVAATPDGCDRAWDRNDTPIELSFKVAKAAKAANQAVYFIADGGVNNTNWVDLVQALAKCNGLDFAMNNLLAGAGAIGAKVKFWYEVPKVNAAEPANGLKQNIIKQGGACYAAVSMLGFEVWSMRIGVPAYDGPGSAAPSARSKRITDDIKAAIQRMLDAGADKIAWMTY